MRLDRSVSGTGVEQGGGRPDPGSATGPSIDLQVDEGLLIVASAFRLALKNLLIVRALRDGADYDESALVAALNAEIGGLITEKEEEAVRLRKAMRSARRRKGWASWHDDYRQQDMPALERRAEISGRLVDRLRSL